MVAEQILGVAYLTASKYDNFDTSLDHVLWNAWHMEREVVKVKREA